MSEKVYLPGMVIKSDVYIKRIRAIPGQSIVARQLGPGLIASRLIVERQSVGHFVTCLSLDLSLQL